VDEHCDIPAEVAKQGGGWRRDEGISREQLEAEVGDLNEYFRSVIDQKNVEEKQRLTDDAIADRRAKATT
jgi:hypothetical protein